MPTFFIGMVFKSTEEFRTTIAKYVIARGVEIKFEKNKTHRVRCKYKQACPWSIFASSDKKSGDFIVKSYHPNHRCTRVWKNRRASYDYLVSYFNDVIEDHPKMTCLQMVEYAKKHLQLEISETMAKRVKRKILIQLEGDYKDDYR